MSDVGRRVTRLEARTDVLNTHRGPVFKHPDGLYSTIERGEHVTWEQLVARYCGPYIVLPAVEEIGD